jgi:hypothetical protein
MLGRWLPMHHGGETPADANWFQRFNDSGLGVFLSSVMHTAGALLFTAGIVAFLLVAHSLKTKQGSRGPWLTLLPYAHWLTIVGIALNGVGGLLRLYESDHPGIDQLGSSLWVQVLFIKHVFLVIGVGLALWVTFKTQAPEPEEEPVPQLGMTPQRITLFSAGSFVTIVIATLLGAVAAQSLVLPAPINDQGPIDHGGGNGSGLPPYLSFSASGVARGTPLVAYSRDALTFPVPNGTTSVVVVLSWTTAQAELNFTLRHEEGTAIATTYTRAGTVVRAQANQTIPLGNWTVVVTSGLAADEPFEVQSTVVLLPKGMAYLENTVVLKPSTRFFEINLEMDVNKTFSYEWSLVGNTNQKIAFNIHTHFDGQVQYLVQGHWNALKGNHTQTRSGGVSLMWEPKDASGTAITSDVRLHYRVVGPFHLHSMAGP